jgi:hypothetical protein
MTSKNMVSRYLVLMLICLFFGQTVAAGPHLSLTADEPVHMAQGYVYWTRGDFRLQRPVAQPPLPDMLPGALLTLQPGPDVEQLDGWQEANLSRFARAFSDWYGRRDYLQAATFASRVPIALVAVLGLAVVFRWAHKMFGDSGGLLAVALLAFDPNFIAHAGLATTDVLLATWTFIAIYTASRWTKSGRTWPWGLLTGLGLGLALGSKTSGFFAVGTVGALLGLRALRNIARLRNAPGDLLRDVRDWATRYLLALGVAFLVLWALYRFETRPLPGSDIPVPFATHWIIWREMSTHLRTGHIAYLLGEVNYTGWWYYYPLAFLLKTPLPTLILLLGTLITGFTSSPRRWWERHTIWLPPLLYGIAAVNSNINIGYRYLLVMLPFLYVLCGGWVARTRRHWQRILAKIFVLWLIISAMRVFPHYLAYFNPLARARGNAADYLIDSNLDWGQGFIALERWTDQHTTQRPLYISYYTFVDPAHYGLDYVPIAPASAASPVMEQRFNPKPGTYALSATPLQGVMIAQNETYDWFRQREPVARPSHAVFVYEVPDNKIRPQWIAQCTVPVAPLTAEAIAEGFGRTDLRHITFDCTQSWVYPSGGSAPGQYALFRETALKGNAFIKGHLVETHLSYEQEITGFLPPFRLYEQDNNLVRPRHTSEKEIQVGNSLIFLGHTLSNESVQVGDTFTVETYWQVRKHPENPLSIMLHLIGPGGTPVVIGDGLGFPVNQWQPGDIFVQKHDLSLPAGAPAGEYTIYTGAYDLETVTPYPIHSPEGTLGERLPLTTLHIP